MRYSISHKVPRILLAGMVACVYLALAVSLVPLSEAHAAGPQVASGDFHSCALKPAGSLSCWGLSDSGQTSVPNELGQVKQLSLGASHSCELNEAGQVICWGANDNRQRDVPGNLGAVDQVSAGGFHTCVVKDDGTARCWGDDYFGQSTVPKDLGTIKELSSGPNHTCAIKTDGYVACWGYAVFGSVSVPITLGKVSQISAGGAHTCAIESTGGKLTCWGDTYHGSLLSTASVVPADLGPVSSVSTNDHHTCAITQDGFARCWGENTTGETDIPDDLGVVTQISSGRDHTCAVTARYNGTRCWGAYGKGQTRVPAVQAPDLTEALTDIDELGSDFGDVGGGSRSIVLRSLVRNTGPAFVVTPLLLTRLELSGPGKDAFSIVSTSCLGQPVARGEFCSVRVRFQPRIWDRGQLSASISGIGNTVIGSFAVPLTGVSMPPAKFVVKGLANEQVKGSVAFTWEASEAARYTITVTQPVRSVVKVRKGRRVITKLVTLIKPVTVSSKTTSSGGPSSVVWNRRIQGKIAAAGKWTVQMTANSPRGSASLSIPIVLR